MKNINRLNLLTQDEINSLYALPQYSKAEQINYLLLNKQEYEAMHKFNNLSAKLYFSLQLAYFKTKRLFFSFTFKQVIQDAEFLLSQHFQNEVLPDSIPSKNTLTAIRQSILKLTQCHDNKSEVKMEWFNVALEVCRTSLNPRTIFEKLIIYIERNEIVMPAYSIMQDLIGKAIKEEQFRLQAVLGQTMPKYIEKALSNLLSTKEKYYEITLIKKDQKNFTYTEIKKAITIKNNYNELYQFSLKLVSKLKITPLMLSYYASLINHYTVTQLQAFFLTLCVKLSFAS